MPGLRGILGFRKSFELFPKPFYAKVFEDLDLDFNDLGSNITWTEPSVYQQAVCLVAQHAFVVYLC